MSSQIIPDLYKVTIHDPQAQPLILQMAQHVCRHVWGSATAYRLGLVSRLLLLDCPYDPDSHLADLFDKGREDAGRATGITVRL